MISRFVISWNSIHCTGPGRSATAPRWRSAACPTWTTRPGRRSAPTCRATRRPCHGGDSKTFRTESCWQGICGLFLGSIFFCKSKINIWHHMGTYLTMWCCLVLMIWCTFLLGSSHELKLVSCCGVGSTWYEPLRGLVITRFMNQLHSGKILELGMEDGIPVSLIDLNFCWLC